MKKIEKKAQSEKKIVDHRVVWMQNKIELDKFENELWIEEYQQVAENFLNDPN